MKIYKAVHPYRTKEEVQNFDDDSVHEICSLHGLVPSSMTGWKFTHKGIKGELKYFRVLNQDWGDRVLWGIMICFFSVCIVYDFAGTGGYGYLTWRWFWPKR